jgi:nicotinamidase-related amidase
LENHNKRLARRDYGTVEMTDLERHDGKFVIAPKRPTGTPEHLTVAGSWPHDGPCRPDEVALLLIDFQSDFIDADGYLAKVGGDIKPAQEVVMKVKPILEAARSAGFRVFHTREGHRPSLADLSKYKKWRSQRAGAEVGASSETGSKFLVRGSPGWDITPELAPIEGEEVIDGPGYDKFMHTDLEHCLRCAGVKYLIVAGLTTEVCVSSTVRGATERGFECLLVTDGTAATEQNHLRPHIDTMLVEGGIFGSVADAHRVLVAFGSMGSASASDPPPTGGPEAPPRPPTQAGDLERPSAEQVPAGEDREKKVLQLQLKIAELELEAKNRKLEAVEEKTRELLAETAWKSSSESVTSSGVA